MKTKKKKARVTIRYESSEAGSSFECSLDGAPFSACGADYSVKVGKGKHSFAVRATDAAGSTDETPARTDWKVKRKRS